MLTKGFSLIEMLIALGVMSVVLMFVFGTFSYQNATYTVTDQIAEVQQNARAVARLMERDIRQAGYLVPPSAAACGVDSKTAADMLFVSDTEAILPADQLPIELAGDELGAETSDEPAGTGPKDIVVDDVVIDGTASYDTNGDGTNDSDFRVGGGAILVDRGNPERGVSCGIVTAVDVAADTVSVDFLAIYNTGVAAADLVLVPAHAYRIVTSAGDPPRLERNGQLLAKDVEDLQVAWFFDDQDAGVIGEVDEPNETRGDADTDYENDDLTGDELREIRINLVVATRTDDPRSSTAAGIGQPRENRTVTSSPGADGKHRRVHTATVRLRNLTL